MPPVPRDDWESALIAKARGDVPVPADDASSDENVQTENLPCPVFTNKKVLGHVNKLVDYATHTGNPVMLVAVATVQSLVQDHCIKQAT